MKRFKLITLIAPFLVTGFLSLAVAQSDEDAGRTANPGDDPNEARSAGATEGSVSAIGICHDCIARIYGSASGKGSRLGDDTTYRPRSGGGSETSTQPGSSTGAEGSR